jgi:hypothetical protein
MRLLWDFNVLKNGKWSSEAAYYCPNCHSTREEEHSEPHWFKLDENGNIV